MDHAKKMFGGHLPTLQQLKTFNQGSGVPPETAWIWGRDDEVRGSGGGGGCDNNSDAMARLGVSIYSRHPISLESKKKSSATGMLCR